MLQEVKPIQVENAQKKNKVQLHRINNKLH